MLTACEVMSFTNSIHGGAKKAILMTSPEMDRINDQIILIDATEVVVGAWGQGTQLAGCHDVVLSSVARAKGC